MRGADLGSLVLPRMWEWMQAYAGETCDLGGINTGYRARKHSAALKEGAFSHLTKSEQRGLAALVKVQKRQARLLGSVPVVKGAVLRDFSPWNFHWSAPQIWGFDVEGHRMTSLIDAAAMFCVLCIERTALPVSYICESLRDAPFIPREMPGGDRDAFIAFILAEALSLRTAKWAGHQVFSPRLARAVRDLRSRVGEEA